MIVYDKQEIKNALTLEDIFNLLNEWGGQPEYCPTGIISRTICHNKPEDEASRKLYYYENSQLFKCYSGCANSIFDIFELYIKVMNLQHNIIYDLNQAIRNIAHYCGINGREEDVSEDEGLEDWNILNNYSRIQDIQVSNPVVTLEEYDSKILNNFNYNIKLTPWLNEGISQEVLDFARIGYYPGEEQITIPHFDKDGRFIGLRGRSMIKQEAEQYGKYRPIKIGKQLYNHPLGLNLYNLNNSKNNISKIQKAIVYEGEKSCLLYQTYFGIDSDISVACCGSSLSSYQIQLLTEAGAQEIIIAFDRQFQKLGDKEYFHLIDNLKKLKLKYKNYVQFSYILDKKQITNYKASPIDEGKEKFLKLFKERII